MGQVVKRPSPKDRQVATAFSMIDGLRDGRGDLQGTEMAHQGYPVLWALPPLSRSNFPANTVDKRLFNGA